MKKLPVLIFCLCVTFSSVCFAQNRNEQSPKDVRENQSQKDSHPFGSFFKNFFGKQKNRSNSSVTSYIPAVESLCLNKSEIKKTCSSESKSCSEDKQIIEVTTVGSYGGYVLNDSIVATYGYKVSGGKIIGEGKKISWDLSNLVPGTYTITAYIDTGCGFCGIMKTQEVKVIECSDCK